MKIAQRRRGNGSTSEELRHDIDSGRTGVMGSAADSTATPLGTDDEAAGAAPDGETASHAREGERNRTAGVAGIADPSPAEESNVEISGPAARQGETAGHMRWVLRISVALVVIGFVLAWFIA